jgi:hypothetical protein
MPNSKVTIDGTDYEFQGDERYTPKWTLAVKSKNPVAEGSVIVGAAKLSEIIYTISGYLISDNTSSADKKLHNLMDALANNVETSSTQTVTLELGSGQLILTGWVTNFTGPRTAPEGESLVAFTFDIILSQLPNHSGIS